MKVESLLTVRCKCHPPCISRTLVLLPPQVAELEATLAAREAQLTAAQEAQRNSLALAAARGHGGVGEQGSEAREVRQELEAERGARAAEVAALTAQVGRHARARWRGGSCRRRKEQVPSTGALQGGCFAVPAPCMGPTWLGSPCWLARLKMPAAAVHHAHQGLPRLFCCAAGRGAAAAVWLLTRVCPLHLPCTCPAAGRGAAAGGVQRGRAGRTGAAAGRGAGRARRGGRQAGGAAGGGGATALGWARLRAPPACCSRAVAPAGSWGLGAESRAGRRLGWWLPVWRLGWWLHLDSLGQQSMSGRATPKCQALPGCMSWHADGEPPFAKKPYLNQLPAPLAPVCTPQAPTASCALALSGWRRRL